MDKFQAFLRNAKELREKFGIVPLLYGSLGLEYGTGWDLQADDCDILIPEAFLADRWGMFRDGLQCLGYVLTDLHEHTFQKDGIEFSYASIESLTPFAGIGMEEIPMREEEGTEFFALTPEQYLSVYRASEKDGYRVHVRNKKDREKIQRLESLLGQQGGTQ